MFVPLNLKDGKESCIHKMVRKQLEVLIIPKTRRKACKKACLADRRHRIRPARRSPSSSVIVHAACRGNARGNPGRS
jgi:hypothetical protein